MNNDLLNSPNKNPKEFNNTNIVYNNNDIKLDSFENNNIEHFEIKKPVSRSHEKKLILGNHNTNKKIKNKNYLNDFYSQEETKNINKGKNMITVNDIFGEEIKREINVNIMEVPFDNFFPGKVSTKSYGPVKAYAANTNQGISRDYNEDRVSIIININQNLSNKCKEKKEWPKASYFSVFDGHGGNKCADFLKNNLLTLICENKFYPQDIEKAIKHGFNEADKAFLKLVQKEGGEITDNSGSCGLILLVFETKIYIANVGDSRCIISLDNGQTRKDVTRDHKPNYPYEKERIIANGGKIYQTQTLLNQNEEKDDLIDNDDVSNIEKNSNLILIGPYRVSPGNLSVSRTIGDPMAKLSKYGGNSKVVISEPDIFCFDLIKEDIDFLILGCDGIYDQLTSQEVLQCAWMMIENNKKILNEKEKSGIDIYNTCANIVDFILKMSMARKSFDNVTCLIIAFKDLVNDNNNITKNNITNSYKKDDIKNLNDRNENSEEKLPNLVKNKTIFSMENIDENKKKSHYKNKKMLNIKNLKIYHDEKSRNRNCLNSEELSHIIRNNIIKSTDNEGNDFLKYKHKLALSIKKNKHNKKLELDNSNNNYNNIFNKNNNNNNLSLKKPKLNLNLTKQLLNNKIKPLPMENKFIFNKKKYKNNFTQKLISLNLLSDMNSIKSENNLIKPLINNDKEINYIQNYNSKNKNYLFHNKPLLMDINNIHITNKDKLYLKDIFNSDYENKTNKNIRLKTLNKKSISFYNNGVNDLNNNRKKIQNKNTFQKNNKAKFDSLSKNTFKSRNNFGEINNYHTVNVKNNININIFNSNNEERIKLPIKPGLQGKNLIHNLTEDFYVDNKRLQIPNINIKK